MNSRILHGYTSHSRMTPVRHTFRYPIYMFIFDIDELPHLDRDLGVFGHNRRRLFSLFDRDYLSGRESEPLKERIKTQLRGKSYASEVARVECVTTPRFLAPTFNPATFYYCFDSNGAELAVVLEVNNTFGERHIYVFDAVETSSGSKRNVKKQDKSFYVSPFYDLDGKYCLSTKRSEGRLHISLDLEKDGEVVFHSNVFGKIAPMTRSALLKTACRYPLGAALTLPRITWEAAKLYYGKSMTVQAKPLPTHAKTIEYERPSLLARLGKRFFEEFLNDAAGGSIEVVYPDGTSFRVGGQEAISRPVLYIHSHKFFSQLAARGDIALGECYAEGVVDSSDLTEVLKFFARNLELVNSRRSAFSLLGVKLIELKHHLRRNTREGSRENIHAHYDLGNELFTRMLGKTMMYSCAFFEHQEQGLEQAQHAKLQKIFEKAQLSSDDHVLEIGTGWGTLAIEAARRYGCRVTSVTLSEEQFAFARDAVIKAGLEDKVAVLLCDYRDVEGQFDKIISVEMLEAVGHEYFETFFGTCDRLLKAGGLAVIQTITIPGERYEHARRGYDWLQQYIFPGSTIPSLERIEKALNNASELMLADIEEIGLHYAPTLAAWRDNLRREKDDLSSHGFDRRFFRMWDYYLCYCEAAFATQVLGNSHLVLRRAGESSRLFV